MALGARPSTRVAAAIASLVCVAGLAGCHHASSTSESTSSAGGASDRASSSRASTGNRAPAACSGSGTTIPAGRYTGSIKATLTTSMHLSVSGVSIPNAGGGTEAMHGSVSVVSDGRTVTGSITLSGLGLSQVGVSGGPAVHSVDNGELTGRISGSASDPIVNGSLSGEWASLDATLGNTSGSASNSVRAGLHVTRAGCDSISGDAIAMFTQIAAPVAQYLSIGGSGTWNAVRS